MADANRLACTSCGQVNRVPTDKLAAKPKCGTCGAALVDGKVAEIDPELFRKALRNDSLPLVVDFWAPWCGPCRMMAPEFAKAAQTLAGKVRFAKLNTEDHPRVSAELGIRGIPLLILFRKGKEVGRLTGARPAADIQAFAQKALGSKAL